MWAGLRGVVSILQNPILGSTDKVFILLSNYIIFSKIERLNNYVYCKFISSFRIERASFIVRLLIRCTRIDHSNHSQGRKCHSAFIPLVVIITQRLIVLLVVSFRMPGSVE